MSNAAEPFFSLTEADVTIEEQCHRVGSVSRNKRRRRRERQIAICCILPYKILGDLSGPAVTAVVAGAGNK